MDVLTHAIVGAVTGGAFGHPVAGAVAAVLPDVAIWFGKRRAEPPELYKAFHSIPCLGWLALVLAAQEPSLRYAVLCSWFSHLVLDVPTHGPVWSPRLLYPFNFRIPTKPEWEWEWFSASWWWGLVLAVIWSLIWLIV